MASVDVTDARNVYGPAVVAWVNLRPYDFDGVTMAR